MASVKVTDATGYTVAGAEVIVSAPGAVIIGLGAGEVADGFTDSSGVMQVPNMGALNVNGLLNAGGTGDVHVKATLNGTAVYGAASWGIDWLGNWTPTQLTIQLTATQDVVFNQLQNTAQSTISSQSQGQTGLTGDIDKALEVVVIVAVVIVALVLFVDLALPALTKAKVGAPAGGAPA